MKISKVLLSLGLMTGLALTLTACGSDNTKPSEAKSGDLQFAKVANSKNETVWYLMNGNPENIKSDSTVANIVVTKNGKSTVYASDERELSYYLKMKDSDIIASVKADDVKVGKKTESEEDFAYKTPTPTKLKLIGVKSDSKLTAEAFEYQARDTNSQGGLSEFAFSDPIKSLTISGNTFAGFYSTEAHLDSVSGDGALITKVAKDSKVTPKLDDVKDVKAYSSINDAFYNN